MKNLFRFRLLTGLLLVIVLLATVLNPIETQAGKKQALNDTVTVQYSFTKPTITKLSIGDTIYDVVSIEHVSCSGIPGEPYLPTRGAYILLPQDMQISDIIVTGKKISLGYGYRVVPTPKPVPIAACIVPPMPVPDESVYVSSENYPESLYTMVGVYSFRGYRILVLMLHPVQYISATGELLFYPYLEVTIKGTLGTTQGRLFRGFPVDQMLVQQKVDNPEGINTYEAQTYQLCEHYDLLILTTDSLKDNFEPLKDKHDALGISTIIKTLTDIGGSSPEAIREYLVDAYHSWGIEYVLLGGDDGVIPAKHLWVFGLDEDTYPYSTYMPSDLYYACLDGTYNYDGDDKWGEPTDGDNGADVDLIADVYVGRACVTSSSEVDYFVQKTLAYLSADDEYLDIFTFAGEYLGEYGVASWGGNYLDQLINGSSLDGYTTVGIPADTVSIDRLYDRDWSNHNWPKSEIITRINNGVHVINHDGHANYGYALKMDTEDVESLINDKYCFIYSQGCMAGGFDNPQGYDCIAEYFTSKSGGGAFAVIMNARYGFFWSFSTDGDSQRYHREFWDAVFGEGKQVISVAHHDSKEDNLYLITRSCMRWVYYETNLLGDPAVAFHIDSEPPQPKPLLNIHNITSGFGINARVKNIGYAAATQIEWDITVTGGILGRINKTATGTISTLAIDAEAEIILSRFFGLGTIFITVSARCAEGIQKTKEIEGRQLFIYTKIRG